MKRAPGFTFPHWNDPFWHVVRMLADQFKARHRYASAIPPDEIIPALHAVGTDAANGLAMYLSGHRENLERLSTYWRLRWEAFEASMAQLRTEAEAKDDFARLSAEQLKNYGVRIAGYHTSSKALVSTVDALVHQERAAFNVMANTNPQSRAAIMSHEHIWVSPRRLDGAIPSLLNPVALWEIKEYWGRTSGGSKMSDAVYELQLVGEELRAFEDEFGVHVDHFAIIDGRQQWENRKSDLRRAIDLLYSGLLDELIVGREVLTEWPRIVRECCARAAASARSDHSGHA